MPVSPALSAAIMVGKRTGFEQGNDGSALDDAHHGRRIAPVGRLVRLQRRLEPRSQRLRVACNDQHLRRRRCCRSFPGRLVETFARGKASMLGAASGAVAGLVAITPAAGFAGPMGAIVMGLIVSPVCYFFVSVVKNKFGYDDRLDVFGDPLHRRHHRRNLTGILVNPALGGAGIVDYSTPDFAASTPVRQRRSGLSQGRPRRPSSGRASARRSSTRSSMSSSACASTGRSRARRSRPVVPRRSRLPRFLIKGLRRRTAGAAEQSRRGLSNRVSRIWPGSSRFGPFSCPAAPRCRSHG